MQFGLGRKYLILTLFLLFVLGFGVLGCGQKSAQEDKGQAGFSRTDLQGTFRVSGA